MTELDVIHTILTTLSLFAAIIVVAIGTAPRRQVRMVRQELLDTSARMDTLEGRCKKLNANYALLLARAKLATGEELDVADTTQRPGETPDQWKRRMRAALAEGKLKVGGTE